MSFPGQAHAMNAVADITTANGTGSTPLSPPRCRRDDGWTTPTPNMNAAAAFNDASYNVVTAYDDRRDGPSELDWTTAPLLPLLPDLISCGEDDLLDDNDEYDTYDSRHSLSSRQRGYLPRPRFSPTILTLPFKALKRPVPPRSCNDRFDSSFRMNRVCESSPTHRVDYGPDCDVAQHGPLLAPMIPLLESSSPELLDQRGEYRCMYFPSVALSMRRAMTAATIIADQ